MNREIALTVIVLVSTTVLVVGILCIYTNSEIQRMNDEITKTKINKVEALSSRFALRLQYVTGMIEFTSKTFPMTEPPIHSNLISDYSKGIPQDADTEKREMARNMLDKKFELDYVFYAMPNGDIYFLEPFSSQINLSQLNFAFRDWYSGALSTGSTYVSEVYVSANEKHNVIAIANPIYNNVNQTLNGIFVGALNLGTVQRSLSHTSLGQNEYLLIVDHNNNIVIDSRKSESDIEIKRLTFDLSNQQQGNQVDITTKTIEGKDSIIAFKTIPVGTHEWSVMSIQPQHDAFVSSNALRNEAVGMIIIIVVITSTSGFFMIKKINLNINLSDKLKHNNSELEIKTVQLKQSDIQKDEFSSMITHELKTPLVPITVYCKMLKSDMIGNLNKEQIDAINVIEKNAKSLDHLINDVLDARKLDIKKLKFNPENVNIGKFFDEIYSAHDPVINQKGHKLVIDILDKHITIKTDKNRLRQVFDNLISNALKFMPKENGLIEISMKKENDSIIFHVKDNGLGIPLDKQDKIFQKFYQVDTSARRKIVGTGLGLAISKGIIEQLGGKIWFESNGITGTTFFIQLPSN